MRIAVASGKGGTGKTTIAVNLAYFNSLPLFDLDVEEPNDHIFIAGDVKKEEPVYRPVPVVDSAKCTLCGKCREVCQYNAIVVLKDSVVIFPEICHSCGACSYFCPEEAISENGRQVGKIVEVEGDIKLVYGELAIGEASPVPLIREVKKKVAEKAILDCPPGVSCPMVESIRDADFVVLVAEPSPLSMHDLKLAVEVVRSFNRPFGVVINKHGLPFDIESYCTNEGMPILGRIPFSPEIAKAYSRGKLLFEYKQVFKDIYRTIRDTTEVD
ncbi:ATP-binding protein [Archaeoglobus veneficus]|uniref:Cobyrinic acid ac-diamide synthase n=1 Tax=Archaeoglobus veneficus (strain DSM 11195 / SNP6) TaxID=693661 RepID=F2KPS7_ARCVS|nr:ATP-binding protein [Archaeoglobus veneficus]AEA47605.1 Cobyrinic acid ac-diamide synthase [Archaeoglobus veneficus SNP6]